MNKVLRFSDNVNGTGLYAKVDISIEKNNSNSYLLEIDEWVDKDWHTSIQFAVEYFFRHYKKGIKIKINELHTMIVDSSNMTVVYTIVKCLSDLLEFDNDLVRFNKDKDYPYFELKK